MCMCVYYVYNHMTSLVQIDLTCSINHRLIGTGLLSLLITTNYAKVLFSMKITELCFGCYFERTCLKITLKTLGHFGKRTTLS